MASANHAEIETTWADTEQELVARYGETDALLVETDKYVKAASLVLESGGQRIPLAKSPVRIIM